MSAFPQHCVLDAGVLIKYLVPEPETPAVKVLMHDLLTDDASTIYVPDLLYCECANVLWKKVQRGEIDQTTVDESLADLLALELTAIPMQGLISSALRIACQLRITAYDACYLALGHQQGVPHITADTRLLNQVTGSQYHVIALSSFVKT